MRKIVLLTVLAFLMAGLFKVGTVLGGLIMTFCWIVGTVILYKYVFALMWGGLKFILNVFDRIWDFLMYRL